MSDAFGRKTSQEVIAELTERIEVLNKLVRSAFRRGWRLYERKAMTHRADDKLIEDIYQQIELMERIEVLKKLVQSAFNEGVSSGMDEFRKSNGGRTWFDSDARKLLGDDKP